MAPSFGGSPPARMRQSVGHMFRRMRVGHRAGTAAATVVVWIAALTAMATAETPPRSIDQMFHDALGVRRGAPGTVIGIAQSTDGYLWLSTSVGLVRFDGVRFDPFTPTDGVTIARVYRVFAAPDGGLWVTSRLSGVSRVNGGRIVSYGEKDGVPRGLSYDLAIERDHTVWIATQSGLAWFDGSRWHRAGAELNVPDGAVRAVLVAADGTVWIGAGDMLMARPLGSSRFRAVTRASDEIISMAQAPGGEIWVADQAAHVRVAAHANGTPISSEPIHALGRGLLFDHDGSLWIAAASAGVVHVRWADRQSTLGPPIVERFGSEQGLSGDEAFEVRQDIEQNIWVATSGGIDIFRKTALIGAAVPPRTHSARLADAGNGAIWVGAENHPLMRVHDRVEATLPIHHVTALARDAAETLWVFGDEGFAKIIHNRLIALPRPPIGRAEAMSLAPDGSGRLLAVFSLSKGAMVFDHGRWSPFSLPGVASTDITLVRASRGERVWVGHDERLTLIERTGAGTRTRTFSRADGLRTGAVITVSDGRDRVWISGADGIAAFTGGAMRMLPPIEGDAVTRVTGIVEDDAGALWLNTNRGIMTLSAAEVARGLDSHLAPRPRVFDYLDGTIGGTSLTPAGSALRGSDNRIWFVGFDSLVWIDPSNIGHNPVPPPVHIESIAVAGTEFPADREVRLPVGTNQLQINYTALSLSIPGRVRFRYRLSSVDANWHDAGGRREAFYTNLAPGRYQFEVIAANNDGIWNERGATATFILPPMFYQTDAFLALVLLAIAAVAWFLYRRRLALIAGMMRERVETRVSERERIARELHDTLLQSVQGLILRFQAVSSKLPPDEPARHALEAALSRADDVLSEGRERVRDLRSAAPKGDLVSALTTIGEDLARESTIQFQLIVDGQPRALHPLVMDEAYWIGREALINAFTHARATRIEFTVAFERRGLRCRCRDDGAGLDEAVLTGGARQLHWGLPGMRERAARIGGTLDIQSRPGSGTDVELRVPGRTAYSGPAMPRWRGFRRFRMKVDHDA